MAASPTRRIVITIRENDPVLKVLDDNRLPGERSTATTLVRLFREFIKEGKI